jgi:hypothetical protein
MWMRMRPGRKHALLRRHQAGLTRGGHDTMSYPTTQQRRRWWTDVRLRARTDKTRQVCSYYTDGRTRKTGREKTAMRNDDARRCNAINADAVGRGLRLISKLAVGCW